MHTFEFHSVTRIIFGRGQFARIGELAATLGKSALVVTNAGHAGDGGPIDGLLGHLRAAGVAATVIRQRGEPTVGDVDAAVSRAREQACDLVIGLGGGSAIDAAKAVAGLLTNRGSALDYMEVVGKGLKILRPATPWLAIPTTAGSGAEVTRNAVLACPEHRFKASIRSEHLLARVALVDPELGVGVRPGVTAAAGMDALCQLIEAYTSKGAGPMTDALALTGIRLAGDSLGRAYADGSDGDAREGMAMAALLGGIALTNAGLGAAHGIAAPLGANYPAPHGAACAALLPHVMRANVDALRSQSPDHPSLARYAGVGRALSGRDELKNAPAIEAGIEFAATLVVELRIPRLATFGLTATDVPGLVELARRSSSMRHNPVALSEEALAGVVLAAL